MSDLADFKENVKQQADIVRVVGHYVQLKQRGLNHWGLCPFHQEKTPSFSVHSGRQWFHCFGCGKSGDVFTFVQQVENISFPEALRLVAEKLDIKLPRTQYSSEYEAEGARERAQLIEMHERACSFFQDQLRKPEAAHARQYLSGRGLSEETIREFRIGFAPDSGYLLRDKWKGEYSEKLIRASGLFTWKEGAEANIYSKFRNRIMFPIANDKGKIIAFTGRTLATDEKAGPKYLNSPETSIYSKSRVLFNLDKARDPVRKLDYAIIVEGQMDCISVYAAGFKNVIASSGTAFSEAQVKLLGRFSKNIVVNFDRDGAGAKAAERSIGMLLEEDFTIKVVTLDSGFDPDLVIRKKGRDAYQRELRDSQDYFTYLLTQARSHFRVETSKGKTEALNFMLPVIMKLPNKIARDAVVRDISQKLEIDFAVLQQELRSAALRRSAEVNVSIEANITHGEKVLVKALCGSMDADFNARLYLLGLSDLQELVRGLPTETLVAELMHLPEQKEIMPADISEEQRSLLAKLVAETGVFVNQDVVEGAVEGLRDWQRLKSRDRMLKAEIQSAERRKDSIELLRLKQEKLRVDRELAAGLN